MSAVAESRIRVCSVQDLVAGSGVAALVGGVQIAIFYLPQLDPPIYAIGNFDPFSKANVLARGLLGDIDGVLVLASPIYKQHFELATGRCLDDESVAVPSYRVHISGSDVWLQD